MPMVRYQISNEYALSDPELYGTAEKDDPEALLEGVAMAGLVGLLRQLGDLAEFASQIFHDLHEEVMVTASRNHGLTLRLHQLEAEFPLIEKTLISQINLPNVVQNDGVDWHTNMQINRNLITSGDMPRFIMDSYEETRGPPRLFTLDKFDVAGAGACLKRYSDPSFFKTEMASCDLIEIEDAPKEKKPRKIKKKALRWKKGETLESLLISSSESQQSNENQASIKAPITKRAKLKSRKLQNLENNSRKFYHAHLFELIESQQKILLSNSQKQKQSCFKREQNGVITKPDILKENIENDNLPYEMQKMHKIYPIQEQNDLSSESEKIGFKDNFIGDSDKIEIKDKFIGDSDEQENFVDALNTIESETETESENKPKLDAIKMKNNEFDESIEELESETGKELENKPKLNTVKMTNNEFDESNEEFFENDDLMDVSSTSSLHTNNNNNLIEDSHALLSIDGDKLSADEQRQENLEDFSSVTKAQDQKPNSPLINHVKDPIIQDDSFESLEMPSDNSNLEEIKISDEAWIIEDLVSNEDLNSKNERLNETCNGEDSNKENIAKLEVNEENNLRNDNINETCNLEDSSVSNKEDNAKLEGTLEGQSILEDSLISNEDRNLRNESINETLNVENSSILNKDDKIYIGLEDPKYSANKLEEIPGNNNNEVSQVELKNISDEILNFEEYLISNREYDNNVAQNTSINEQEDSYAEKDGSLQYDQKYISDEILNNEDLISFKKEEIAPTNEETPNLPKNMDVLEFKEKTEYLSDEKDESTLEETLIQTDESTLFEKPKDFSNEPFSPNKSQMGDFIEPIKEEENSLKTLDPLEKLNEPKDWQEYLVEKTLVDSVNPKQEYETTVDSVNPKQEYETTVDSVNPKQEYETTVDSVNSKQEYETTIDSVNPKQEYVSSQYNFENNSNLLDSNNFMNHENPFERDIHLEDKNIENLIFFSDNEEDYSAGAKWGIPTTNDFLWEPASPPREKPFNLNDAFSDMNGAFGSPIKSVHRDYELYEQKLDTSNNNAYEKEVVLESSDEKEEYVGSASPAGTVDQAHEMLRFDEPLIEKDGIELSDDQLVEKDSIGPPAGTVDQVHEVLRFGEPLIEKDGIELSNEMNINQLDIIENLSKESEEDSDCLLSKNINDLKIEKNINEINEGPLFNNPFPTATQDFINTKPNPNSTSIDNNASDLDLSDIFSFVSHNSNVQNSNLNLQNEEKDKMPPLPPLGWRIGGKLRKGFSLPANGFVPVKTPDPFVEMPSISNSVKSVNVPDPFVEMPSVSNSVKPVNAPDLFVEMPSVANSVKPVNTPDLFAEMPSVSNSVKPVNTPDPFVEMPSINDSQGVEKEEPDLVNTVNVASSVKPVNEPNLFVEMPCIKIRSESIDTSENLQKLEGEKPLVVSSVNPNLPLNPFLGQNPDQLVEMDSTQNKSENISTIDSQKECENQNILEAVNAPNLFVEMPSTETSPNSQVIVCADDLQKIEGENEKQSVASLSNLPPISNLNPPPNPILEQNVQNLEGEKQIDVNISNPNLPSNPFIGENVQILEGGKQIDASISNPNPPPNPFLGQNVQNLTGEKQIVTNISNPNLLPNPILGQNVQNLEGEKQIVASISNPNPLPNPILRKNFQILEGEKQIVAIISNPYPLPNPILGQNVQNLEGEKQILANISNPNPPPNPFLGQNIQNFEYKIPKTDPNTNLFLPVSGWATGPAQVNQPSYLIPLEDNMWAQYNIGPSIENEKLGLKPYSIKNIPRNPLMDAVAAHDRSTMRKVSELAKPTENLESEERNSLLEQIRNKSFSLKPVGAPKVTAVKAPQTNLKVAAIVEKANAIRQACVGSDEDDEDSWSD